MSEKKRSPKKDTILHSIQVGDVIAIISSQQSNSGFVYRPFKLLRCFVTSTGKQSRATTFFAKNARDCARRHSQRVIGSTCKNRPTSER